MDSLTRLETAWSFREPDRVPIELTISSLAREQPEARRLAEFVDREADNFLYAPGFDWGFLGLDGQWSDEVIEEVPGAFKRIRHTVATPVGVFEAVTRHSHGELDPGDFAWERRYIRSLEDLERLAAAPRAPRAFNRAAWEEGVRQNGSRGISGTGVFHPLGSLVRMSTMEEVYGWFVAEPGLMHRFLDATNRQAEASVLSLQGTGLRPVFYTWALEMLTPPWFGRRQFDEFVFPYDKRVNDAIHRVGARHRAHCHGNSGGFLERFADMGIDALEPLEPPPYGDNHLADAKRRVGRRMMLSGNILSQDYLRMSDAEIRDRVRAAIREGAPGGGFSLRCAGGDGSTGSAKDMDQLRSFIHGVGVYLDAALEFGSRA